MPFLAPLIPIVIGAVGAASGAITAVEGAVNTGVNVSNGVALGTLASITKELEGHLEKSFNSAFNLFESATSNLFAGLGAAITGALATIGKIISNLLVYIKQFLDPILKLLNEFAALFDIIRRTYQAINTMVEVLHADIHGGILGILSIPKTLSDGLTAVEAQTTRAIQILSDQNKSNISDVLIPGMSRTLGDPLQQINKGINSAPNRDYKLDESIRQIPVGECNAGESYAGKVQHFIEELEKESSIVAGIAHVLKELLFFIPYYAKSIEQQLLCVGQEAARNNPAELLGVEDVIEAVHRGEMSRGDAEEEVRRRGFSLDRFQILMETSLWLPDVLQALQLYHRGSISRDELSSVLTKQRLTETDVQAVDSAFLEPDDPQELIGFLARLNSRDAGFLSSTLGSQPPNDIVNAYRPRYQHPVRASTDWMMHWKIPGLDWWLTSYLRGLVSLDDVKNAAIAESIPGELFDKLVSAYQDTMPVFHLSEALALGIMDEDAARKYMHFIGLDDQSIDIMIKLGQAKQKAPFAALGATLAGVSEANARKMYDDHIIDEAVYKEILEAHGTTPEAAALIVELSKQENAIASRKTFATGLVDEVNTGQLTLEAMVSTLFGQGFKKDEVDAYVLKVKQAKTAKAKQLSEAQLTDLFRHAIIDEKTYTTKLGELGYSAVDSQLLLTLEITLHGNPSQPGATS